MRLVITGFPMPADPRMRAPKPKRSTPWRPASWERRYRGVVVWVDEMYTTSPRWTWTTEIGPEGRAKTRLSAMRAAELSVDKVFDD